jgi:hypothetical protein
VLPGVKFRFHLVEIVKSCCDYIKADEEYQKWIEEGYVVIIHGNATNASTWPRKVDFLYTAALLGSSNIRLVFSIACALGAENCLTFKENGDHISMIPGYCQMTSLPVKLAGSHEHRQMCIFRINRLDLNDLFSMCQQDMFVSFQNFFTGLLQYLSGRNNRDSSAVISSLYGECYDSACKINLSNTISKFKKAYDGFSLDRKEAIFSRFPLYVARLLFGASCENEVEILLRRYPDDVLKGSALSYLLLLIFHNNQFITRIQRSLG